MPEYAYPGQNIPVNITISVANDIVAPAQGFYFVDNILDNLSLSISSYEVSQNGQVLYNVIVETGSSGDIYPLSTPSRVILEIPPLFSQENLLSGGDAITIEYRVRIPSGAVSGTEYTFPGYSWAAKIQGDSGEAIFGYEDLPEVTILVVEDGSITTTTYPGPFPPTTTTTIVSDPTYCGITIQPDTAELLSSQSLHFVVESGSDCGESNYAWSVESLIGSTCNQSGNYTAGINFNLLKPKTDLVTVIDYGNSGITSQATINVYSACAMLNVYGNDLRKIELLRKYRDSVLRQSPEGQTIINLYYVWSPILIQLMQKDEIFKEDLKSLIDTFLQETYSDSN